MAPSGSPHPPSLTVPSPSIFSDLARHSSVWNSICSRVRFAPAGLPSAHLRTVSWLHHPFPTSWPSLACVLLSNQARGEGRRPGFRPCCPHVLSRPPLPPYVVGQPSLFLFPIATEAAWAPALPVPAPRRPLHSHFLSPGAGAPEARPGQARPGRSGPRGASVKSCPSLWALPPLARTSRLPPPSQASIPLLGWQADWPPCACRGPPPTAAWPGGYSSWASGVSWPRPNPSWRGRGPCR